MKHPNWKVAAKFWKWKYENHHLAISKFAVLRFDKKTQKEILLHGLK
jgi:hypothetical protein